jgi:hypothetical protein
MGGKYVPADSLGQARARIGLIAEELARRSSREHLEAEGRKLYEQGKTVALEKAEELKVKAKEFALEKADELKVRAKEMALAKREELKARAKAQVRLKAEELKEQAMKTGTGYAFIGALTGAAAGAAWGRYQKHSGASMRFETLETADGGVFGKRDRVSIGVEGQAPIEELSGRVSEAAESAKEKAGEVVEKVKQRAGELREKVPSIGEVREKSVRFGRGFFRDQPFWVACGAIAIGAIAAMWLPVSESERRLLMPAQDKARESIRKVGAAVQEKISEVSEQVTEKIDHLGEEQHEAEAQGSELSVESEPPAIH